jgi:hypothetical protein
MQENKWPSVSLLNWAQGMALANAFDRSNAVIFIYTHLEIVSRSSQLPLSPYESLTSDHSYL